MSSLLDRDDSYFRALPHPHPAIEKYHFTMADIHQLGMTYGLAPPTLFGILIGRIKSNEIIDLRLEKFLDREDVAALREDYDPLRHFQFVDLDNSRNMYHVQQRYPAGLCKKGDGLHTHDGRWIIINDVERTNTTVRFFSGNALLTTMSKSILLTVAVSTSVVHPNVGDIERAMGRKSRKSTVKFFENETKGDFSYDQLYKSIYDSLD